MRWNPHLTFDGRCKEAFEFYEKCLGGMVVAVVGYADMPNAQAVPVAQLIRDIFGNPFRPVTFLPEWRTSTVLALAQEMDDSRDFSMMPILADTLQDAGSEDEAILTHNRGRGLAVAGA